MRSRTSITESSYARLPEWVPLTASETGWSISLPNLPNRITREWYQPRKGERSASRFAFVVEFDCFSRRHSARSPRPWDRSLESYMDADIRKNWESESRLAVCIFGESSVTISQTRARMALRMDPSYYVRHVGSGGFGPREPTKRLPANLRLRESWVQRVRPEGKICGRRCRVVRRTYTK